MKILKYIVFFVFIVVSLISFKQVNSQVVEDSIRPHKIYVFTGTALSGYSVTMYSLYQAWYKNYDHSSFHFFDDSKEWLQMDKLGHSFSSYYLSSMLCNGFTWSGVKRNKAVLLGTGASLIAMSSIEVFDGFSSKWGASMTDLTANVCGGLLFAGQELVLNKQIFRLKYSYHQTEWPKYRPDALGENDFQRVIKDYNGQTYWLSGNIRSLTRSKNIPSWLNFAIGYSGEAMCGGVDNSEANWGGVPVTTERYRQYYFSLDADLTQIKVKSKFMKTLFRAVNCIKIPFPALVLEKNRFSVNPLYF